MKKLCIIFKTEDQLILGTAEKLSVDLSKQFKIVPLNKVKDADFILTLGGDGTTLKAARLACFYEIPLLPVHLGGLGLLTEISLQEIPSVVSLLEQGKFKIDSRIMLKAQVFKGKNKTRVFFALNDIVLCKSDISRTIKLQAYIKQDLLSSYIADGLIVSTPTGSTAYNFAAMGPVMDPHSNLYVLSPICPHRGANRSIVLKKPVEIKLSKGDEFLLTADGQETLSLDAHNFVKVGIAKETTKFIRFKKYDIWKLLREKMGW